MNTYFLTIKTDSDLAELGLYDGKTVVKYKKWESFRQLSQDINKEIDILLKSNKIKYDNLAGIVIYSGPGSFTGLRIGFSAANTLSYSLNIPIVKTNNDDWQNSGIKKLLKGSNQYPVMPIYGAEPHITKPKK